LTTKLTQPFSNATDFGRPRTSVRRPSEAAPSRKCRASSRALCSPAPFYEAGKTNLRLLSVPVSVVKEPSLAHGQRTKKPGAKRRAVSRPHLRYTARCLKPALGCVFPAQVPNRLSSVLTSHPAVYALPPPFVKGPAAENSSLQT
jgi:hypothetical protein